MVNKQLGVKSAKEVNGATMRVRSGSTTELNLADYIRANKMTLKRVVFDDLDKIRAAFFAGRCDVFTGDRVRLYATRTANAPNPDNYVILAEIISKEPLGQWSATATINSPTSWGGRSSPCSKSRN